MSFSNTDKSKVIEEHRRGDSDTGSPEVQIALLTKRIENLKGHFAPNPKDYHSNRGMMKMISRRRRLLDYLKGESLERYNTIIKALGIRK